MKRTTGWFVPALVTIFFFSGAAGLAYQVLWAKAFGAGIGHEYPAALAVVTAFMCGIALGGVGFDFFRGSGLVRSYAFLELVIGVWGALTLIATPALNRFIIHLLGVSPDFTWHWVVVFSSVFLGLLPATAAMGATLPAVERILAAKSARNMTGLLYGANTAGAMCGALLAAFGAMPLFGIRNSILFFAALNIACAGASLYLVPAPPEVAPARPVNPRRTGLAVRLFVTGLLGIGFETVMIRALSNVLENTVYTFAVVLAVYLFGTAVGAALFQRFGGKNHHLFAGLAISCLISGVSLRWLPGGYLRLRSWLGDSLVGVAFAESAIGFLALLLPALCMGAAFSALASESRRDRPSLGWSVSINAAGAAAAPVVFGLFLIPRLGWSFSIAAIALGYSALAARAAFWLVPISALMIPLLSRSTDLIARGQQKIVFHREGLMASVSVLESTNRARVLKVNNRFQMGGTSARIAESRHADIPLLLHPHPARALFIGLGTGITFGTAANYPGMTAEGVELLPEVVEAMPYFQDPAVPIQSSNLRVYVADGRRFALAATARYDVIVGDLFHPAQDGTAFLYTREHFAAVRERLAAGGLFCQWIPLFQMDLATFDIIARTFGTVFPGAELWLLRFNIDTPVAGLIGWNGAPQLPGDLVERKAEDATLKEHLRTVALGDTLRLLGCRLGPVDTRRGRQFNTDDRPVVLFDAPGLTYQQRDDPGERLLQLLDRYPVEPGGRLGDFATARNTYLRGLVLESRGDRNAAVKLFVESARISSDFTSGYAQALGMATALAHDNPVEAQVILRALIDAQPARPVARQLLEKLNR